MSTVPTSYAPPPDLVEGEQEYEVEGVLDSRLFGRGKNRILQYWVKWKGYPHSDNTWEPSELMENSKEYTELFHEQHPKKPRSPTSLARTPNNDEDNDSSAETTLPEATSSKQSVSAPKKRVIHQSARTPAPGLRRSSRNK